MICFVDTAKVNLAEEARSSWKIGGGGGVDAGAGGGGAGAGGGLCVDVQLSSHFESHASRIAWRLQISGKVVL